MSWDNYTQDDIENHNRVFNSRWSNNMSTFWDGILVSLDRSGKPIEIHNFEDSFQQWWDILHLFSGEKTKSFLPDTYYKNQFLDEFEKFIENGRVTIHTSGMHFAVWYEQASGEDYHINQDINSKVIDTLRENINKY